MSKTLRLAAVPALLATMLISGCVPSDYEIQSELTQSRREAYLEWKTAREQGGGSEARVNGPLTLDEAVRLALQYNKVLQRQVMERQVTRGERISAYQVITPSLNSNFGAYRYENYRNADLFRYSTGVTITQPIFQGEYIPASLRQARLYTALTDESVRNQVQNLISDVANAYYDVLLHQHMVEVNQEALISAQAQYRMVSEKKKQETATEYDVLRAQVDVANYQAKVQNSKNAIDASRVLMQKYMGVSQDSEITFSDALVFLPMRPVVERAVELAFGLRPDIRSANLSSRAADEAVRISRSAFWPQVAASFNQNWADGSNASGGSAFRRNPWYAGLQATYNLGVQNFGDIVAMKAKARQAQIDILDSQETAIMEIHTQMYQLANAEETIRYLEVNQDAARESLRLVEVGYQAGVKTEVDVTDARKALTEVMGEYYSALANHTKARLALQLAMGVLGPCQVTDGTQLPPTVPIANIEEFAATDYEPPSAPVMPTSPNRTPTTRPRATDGAYRNRAPAPQSMPFTPSASDFEDTASLRTNPVQASQQPFQMPAATAQFAPVSADALSLPLPDSALAAPMQTQPAAGNGMRIVVSPSVPATVQTQAETPAPRPMFKVKVREGAEPVGDSTIDVATLPRY